MIAISDGDLVVVAPPGGTVRFGADQIDEAEAYSAAISLGLEVLRMQRPPRKKSGHHPKRRRS